MATCATCGAALPADARFCPSCGASAEARPAPEERKVATVLFADLVGSTRLGHEHDDPERTRRLLDRYYEAMAAEITAAGGTVEKFIGDAVVAVFGAPAALEDHAERALHVALSLRRRMDELFGDDLRLRIGVNTGEVVVGRPPDGLSLVTTGDAVNVAARLEQAAEPGEILAGERTAAAARGAFEFGDPATVEAKGKPGGVKCRRLVRELSLMRPRGVSGLALSFVGRDSELEVLQATFRRVVDRREPHLVTIMGEAGVGKTRLIRELWQWLASQEPEPLRRTGRCLPYGQIAYWALGEVLKEHLAILESDPPEAALRRLAGREILGLALGLDVGGDLHPLAARERLHQAWVSFLEELAGERPGVVLVEDLHWAEEPLLDLVERILRDVHAPLLLLGTARPEILDLRPAWGGGRRNASLLWLEPLSEAESSVLLAGLLASELPAKLHDAIVQRAEGNPFFVEELVGALIDQGVLERRDGAWTARALPRGFTVPDSVQAIIAARMDLLAPSEKAGLQAASVIGRTFWTGPVAELLEGAEAEPDWTVLEDRDFVRRRSGSSLAGEDEYAFKHALTREVAYATLPKARRAHLHALFAEWLERSGGGRDEHAPLLAHHYAEAVRAGDADLAWAGEEERLSLLRRKALEWLRGAADLAVGRYALDDGLALLRRALPLEPSRAGQADLWHALGRAHALKFDGQAFWTAMERAIESCDDEELRADLYSDLALHTVSRSGMWKQHPERQLVDGWIEQALQHGPEDGATRTKALIARSMWIRSRDSADAAGAAREASGLAEQLEDPELRSMARVCRLLAAYHAGDYDQALTWAERSFELVDDLNDPDLVADICASGALASAARGRFGEAQRLTRLHDEVTAKLTTHHRVHGVAMLLELDELLGNWPRVRELEGRAIEAVEANLDTPCVRNPRSLLVCAVAAEHEGDREGARALEQRADELPMEGYGLTLDGPRVRLALARGDRETVSRLLALHPPFGGSTWMHLNGTATRLEGLALIGARDAVESEAPALLKQGTYLEPFALRALGVVREDEELVRQALERFETMGLDWHAAQTRALL